MSVYNNRLKRNNPENPLKFDNFQGKVGKKFPYESGVSLVKFYKEKQLIITNMKFNLRSR